MTDDIDYITAPPDESLSDFVESFWTVHNHSDKDRKTIGLPDGRIDLLLVKSPAEPFRMLLIGLETRPYEQGAIPAGGLFFAVSFKLPAVEYIFREPIADILNNARCLPENFWEFKEDDMNDFDAFRKKATLKIQSLLPAIVDARKRSLFELIYTSKGSATVKELSEKAFWSSRQINRYFNQQFGISLKTFCNILRFRASLEHIAKGELFPEENFFDQTHFIKEIKKFSGVVPKELFQNKNDRFILLSAIKLQYL